MATAMLRRLGLLAVERVLLLLVWHRRRRRLAVERVLLLLVWHRRRRRQAYWLLDWLREG